MASTLNTENPDTETLGTQPDSAANRSKRDTSGIALFMVMAAISVLSILVTEFTYVAQVNQTIAYDGLDQLKTHYLAKSALKLSLLRLKAFQQVKNLASSMGASGGAVPRSLLDKIWSFPFMYPIPTAIPGLTMQDKDAIEKFQKGSGLEGSYTAVIESESSKFNLNSTLPQFAASPSPSPQPAGGPPPTTGTPGNPNAAPSTTPFNSDNARQSLHDYLAQTVQNKMDSDPDFETEYRDLRVDDLVDNILAYSDPTYERKNGNVNDIMPMRKAPFATISELHTIQPMDDTLYDLFAPGLTASTTPGININTMKEGTLRALVPTMTKEEVADFFKFRDSMDEDNAFKSPDDFFTYLTNSVATYKGNTGALDQLKADLTKRNIQLVVDENQFKITVQAKLNQATRLIEAWVALGPASGGSGTPKTGPSPNPLTPPPGTTAPPGIASGPPPDPGLKIIFMRIL